MRFTISFLILPLLLVGATIAASIAEAPEARDIAKEAVVQRDINACKKSNCFKREDREPVLRERL
ncbi:hypothetical protein K525DRAFT_273130 [Schizophyllum commune Loenen D]|nr:hypothetical protein K525DRAFT_273130 [Schizophyllum commune Loenen D]